MTLVSSSAYAQSDQVRRGPPPAWAVASEPMPVPDNAAGPVFMRRQDVVVHLGAREQAQFFSYRVKILQPSALQLGNIAIGWNPAAGAPTVHGITVYRGAETIDVLKAATFEVLRREDQLEAARLDGMLTAVLRIPDLRVGDELEVSLTALGNDPNLGTHHAGVLVLGPSPAPGRYRLGLNWDAAAKPTLKPTADLASAIRAGDRSIDLRFDNPAPLSPPKDAPARYQWQRAVEYSDFADWAAVSRHFAPLYAAAAKLGADSPVRREAARIAATSTDPLTRASAALKVVQQDVRYVYVGLNGGNLKPASAEETWQRRYGDCKGKTVLLLALLAELGVPAEPVLVNAGGTDDGMDQRLPGPQLFDHVLVRARVGGKPYWLDGTLPSVALPSARPVYASHWVLPLVAQGASLEGLGWQAPATPDEVQLFEVDARKGFDTPARITTTSILRGLKGLEQQMQFSSLQPAQLLAGFRQNAIGDTWQAIDSVEWHYDTKAAASVLTIVGTGTVNWSKDGLVRGLALAGGGFNPPERRVRAAGDNQDAPFYTAPEFSCYATTVRLPTTSEVQHWSAKPGFDTRMFGRNFFRAFELRDGAIRMVRGSRVEQPEIDAASAKRDNARIASFDNSMAWISYDPTDDKAKVGNGERVPATYEIDWTASDVPCLAPKTKR